MAKRDSTFNNTFNNENNILTKISNKISWVEKKATEIVLQEIGFRRGKEHLEEENKIHRTSYKTQHYLRRKDHGELEVENAFPTFRI